MSDSTETAVSAAIVSIPRTRRRHAQTVHRTTTLPPFAQANPVSLNEAHWAYVDSIVAKAAVRNMYVCLSLMWGQNAETMFPDPYNNNYQYGRLVGQRYASNNAVLFAGSGEYHKITAPPDDWKIVLTPEQVTLVARIEEGLEDGHGGERLNTMHPNAGGARHSTGSSSQHFQSSPWLDFCMIQSWGGVRYIIELVHSDYARIPAKPTLNGEPGYEDRHLHNKQKDGSIDAWHCRVEAYWALFSGAFGHTYGNSFAYFTSPTWTTALHSTVKRAGTKTGFWFSTTLREATASPDWIPCTVGIDPIIDGRIGPDP